MKKFWALMIAVVFVFSVFALASCGKQEETTDSTTAATQSTTEATQSTTTATPAETSATDPAETTEATDPEGTTATDPAETTEATDPEGTTATDPAETTEATDPEETSEAESTTTLALNAYFDFGTASYAVKNNLTNHDWLVEICEYDSTNVYIEYKTDSWVIWSLTDYSEDAAAKAWALNFNDLVISRMDYEVSDGGNIPNELNGIGLDWGTWNGFPYRTDRVGVEGQWVGGHQYMKIRIKNNTTNNMIGFSWKTSGGSYYTTMRCSNLYLQGKIGEETTTASEDYIVRYYDVRVIQSLASNRIGWSGTTLASQGGADHEAWASTATYAEFLDMLEAEWEEYGAFRYGNGNLGMTGNGNVGGMEFYFLGAIDPDDNPNCDSRENVKAGTWVEVDYVLFGSTMSQLEKYQSYDELGK